MSIALLNSYWAMYIDYKNLVFEAYQQKKLANTLPLNLMYPTSAKLKAECKAACESRYSKNDEKSLKTFFGQFDDKSGCLKAIAKCATDKFKPLANFLKAVTADTDIKNIELLAWLIDFKLRPFEFGKKYDAKEYKHFMELHNANEKNLGEYAHLDETETVNEALTKKSSIITDRITVSFKKNSARGATVSPLTDAGVVARFHEKEDSIRHVAGQEKYMYWNGDRYETITCSQIPGNSMLVPYDAAKLSTLKKITNPETITLKAKGRVWYAKRKGGIEFFTSDGPHPTEQQLRLKPISNYIIKKYVFCKK
ncbi:hypothetical protein QEG73_23120 [Chitinophagaceae bacterium 26-R-25]|nr:hypothetical protein [Chitinophagaceae bacterium 26-R-25]